MGEGILQDIAIIFGLSAIVLWICNRVQLPAIVGFLITGIISGPYGLHLIRDIHDVDVLAEIGIILLLFTVGLEFSFSRLWKLRRYFFWGGILQVSLTILISFLVAQFLSRPLGESLLLGFLLAMSSTVVVLKSLEAQDEIDSPHGQISMGILIFQDIIAIPMMLLIPVLGEGSQQSLDLSTIGQLLLGLLTTGVVCLIGVKVIPWIFYHVAKTRNRELFCFTVLTLCFAVAWLASLSGLSLAIGAFLAGTIISESEYRHEAVGNILPLGDIFTSFFFISTGMLLNISFVLQNPLLIVGVTLAVMAMKASVMGLTVYLLGLSLRVMVLSGIALSQIGEFAFVLAKTGVSYGLADPEHYELFLSVALLSMALSPMLIRYAHSIAQSISKLPISEHWKSRLRAPKLMPLNEDSPHLLIIGFGIAGRNVAQAAKRGSIPYVVLEMNPETVRTEKGRGEPIFFGDATYQSVLHHVCAPQAKVIAVMINDPQAACRVVERVRKMAPEAFIIARIRYVQDVAAFKKLGANEALPDDFGASLELSSRILRCFKINDAEIESFVTDLRENHV